MRYQDVIIAKDAGRAYKCKGRFRGVERVSGGERRAPGRSGHT
jgi:hypothetical protein